MRCILTVVLFCHLSWTVFSSENLIHHYPLDGNAANVVNPLFPGTVFGAVTTEDRNAQPGKACFFDGINDYIDCDTLDFVAPVSISLWMKSSVVNACWNTIFGWNNHESGPNYEGIQIFTDGMGRIDIRMGIRDDDFKCPAIVDGDNTWHHVVIALDNMENVRVYVDAKFAVASVTSHSIGNHHPLFFGKSHQPDSYTEFFSGHIDDVRIYNKALSLTEIQDMYKIAGVHFKADPNTVGLWRFNEGTGSTAYDSSGKGRHGMFQPGLQWYVNADTSAVYGDATSEYVLVPNMTELETARGFRLEAMVKVPVFNSEVVNPFIHIGRQDQLTITLMTGSNRQQKLCFQTNGPCAGGMDPLEYPLPGTFFGKWNHVAAEYSNKVKKLFLNGILVAQDTIDTLYFPPQYYTYLGSDTWGSPAWKLNGFIDEIKVSLLTGLYTPIGVKPEDAAEIGSGDTLIWLTQGNPAGTVYDLQISTLPSFTVQTAMESAVQGDRIGVRSLRQLSLLPLFTHLFWRVRAVNGNDTTAWSTPSSFYLLDKGTGAPDDYQADGRVSVVAQPNPFNGTATIRLTGINPRAAVMTVHDIQGRIVARRDGLPGLAWSWNGSNLPCGVYMLKIMAGNKYWTQKLLLKK